jgi:hypothetical protein
VGQRCPVFAWVWEHDPGVQARFGKYLRRAGTRIVLEVPEVVVHANLLTDYGAQGPTPSVDEFAVMPQAVRLSLLRLLDRTT